MSLDQLLASVERSRRNQEARTKNSNVEANADPLHELVDNSVTKSHALSRAYYRFGLVEKRCMESLISKLHPLRSDNLQDIELLATAYAKAFPDTGKHAYEHLASAVDALLNRVIIIHEKTGKVRKIPLMSEAVYEEKAGKITASFNPKIVPHLIGMRERFSSYPLKQAVNFSSSYAWRFYELLVSWAQPKKETNGAFMGWIDKQSVDELRQMLGVPDSYSWSKFEGQVLGAAITELREKAHIVVYLERIKTSRKITHINIKFIEDEQIPMPLSGGELPKKPRKGKATGKVSNPHPASTTL